MRAFFCQVASRSLSRPIMANTIFVTLTRFNSNKITLFTVSGNNRHQPYKTIIRRSLRDQSNCYPRSLPSRLWNGHGMRFSWKTVFIKNISAPLHIPHSGGKFAWIAHILVTYEHCSLYRMSPFIVLSRHNMYEIKLEKSVSRATY